MAQIICRDLSLGYENQAIVKELSFTVEAGDFLCIIGQNGSGKTTLMKTLLGLHEPMSGKIEMGDGMTHRSIGYLPQQTLVQRDFPASVREIVQSGCQSRCGLRPFYSREEKRIVRKNMERMGIATLQNRCYRELSGGQQQRVLLARALCAARNCLLLDEPVAGLDPKVTAEMYGLIEGLNREGITIIMITHDMESALTMASHILYISDRPFFGTREDFLESEAVQRFLSMRKEEKKDGMD